MQPRRTVGSAGPRFHSKKRRKVAELRPGTQTDEQRRARVPGGGRAPLALCTHGFPDTLFAPPAPPAGPGRSRLPRSGAVRARLRPDRAPAAAPLRPHEHDGGRPDGAGRGPRRRPGARQVAHDTRGRSRSPHHRLVPPGPRWPPSATGSPLRLGAQNVHWAPEGAGTGEVPMQMVADTGATSVELGHSERRASFGRDRRDGCAEGRCAALDAGLRPAGVRRRAGTRPRRLARGRVRLGPGRGGAAPRPTARARADPPGVRAGRGDRRARTAPRAGGGRALAGGGRRPGRRQRGTRARPRSTGAASTGSTPRPCSTARPRTGCSSVRRLVGRGLPHPPRRRRAIRRVSDRPRGLSRSGRSGRTPRG